MKSNFLLIFTTVLFAHNVFASNSIAEQGGLTNRSLPNHRANELKDLSFENGAGI